MTYFGALADRADERYSRASIWAWRLASFSVPLLILGLIAHRKGYAETPAAIAVYGSVFLLSMLAVVLGVSALVSIWNKGGYGITRAIFALLVGGAVTALPVAAGIQIWRLPQLNDVSTDPDATPSFEALASVREALDAPVAYDDPDLWLEQLEAYPRVVPLRFDKEFSVILDVVQNEMREAGWTIVATRTSDVEPREAVVEAVATTPIFAFQDDVLVRIAESGEVVRVDMRSSSRFGAHDLGANARRIVSFLERVEAAVKEMDRV